MPADPLNTTSSSLLSRLSARSSFISPKQVKVTVQLLDDSDSISNEFKKTAPAQAILDYICELRHIHEKDYFGLRFQDHHKHRYWVDLSKPISTIVKQLKNIDCLNLRLRVRYYPSHPSNLRERTTRYWLAVQLQRDILHGRLYCSQTTAAHMGALILQAQLGDRDENVHKENYVSEFKLLLKQTPKVEEKVAEIHSTLVGKTQDEAELEFLDRASKIETYGFDPYTVKDAKDGSYAVYLGVTHRGILIFHGHEKAHTIPWDQVAKVDYSGKDIKLILLDTYEPPLREDKDTSKIERVDKDKKSRLILRYACPSHHFAKHLWNHILSQQAFYNEKSATMVKPKFSKPRIALLSRGSTFRYPEQRVLREIEDADKTSSTEPPSSPLSESFTRYELPKQERRKEQPWLNTSLRSQTLPAKLPQNGTNHNNNNNYLVNANQTLDVHMETTLPKPILLTPNGNVSTTSSGSGEHVTSFAVHLVKYERSPSASPEPDFASSSLGEPLHTSTPVSSRSVYNEKPVASANTPNGYSNGKTNGVVANGHTDTATTTTTSSSSSESTVTTTPHRHSSVVSRVTNVVFASFLFLLLLAAVVIAVFEREDSSWVDNNDSLSHIRHAYYEPAREWTVANYRKFTSR